MPNARQDSSGTATVDLPEEFRVYLEYLELADPEAYAMFQRQADISLP